MDILIPHSWLRDYLKTAAAPKDIEEYLSLCGPTIDKVSKVAGDSVYHIEVTTNRVDAASVYGVAREAAAILPRFNVTAQLQPIKVGASQGLVKNVDWIEAEVDHNLCSRFAAILIRNVKIKESVPKIKQRLSSVGVRPINNVVDISNYLMHELGQPVHTFDYDKILKAKMTLRASRKGEKLTTLDGKTHKLPGGDIVIEDGGGRLIDLAGIMGGKNSAVDRNTKNVLLFVQTYNPVNIRKTSMILAQRTEAAMLFEKGLDPELVETAIRRGIDLFEELAKGRPEGQILDLYPRPYQPKSVSVELDFINKRLGIELPKKVVSDILKSLGFTLEWQDDKLSVQPPSWRANDIGIPEDIVEEVARIYGYHNLPSELIGGKIPEQPVRTPFDFEQKVKLLLRGWGGVEVYTYSLVSKEKAALGRNPSWVLKLKNPLGADTEYLRLSLAPSLLSAVKENAGEKKPFHLFEVANVYLPIRGSLPEEKMTLAGIFAGYQYREAKGVIEALLEQLNIEANLVKEDASGFLSHGRLSVRHKKKELGQFGVLEEGHVYYEFDVEVLSKASRPLPQYQPPRKYPAQIEDISLVLPPRTLVGEVIEEISKADKQIVSVELIDIYKDSITLRLSYQNPKKTLTDREVEKIRRRIIKRLKRKFGVKQKE